MQNVIENPDLNKVIAKENKLKTLFVDYVGNKLKPVNNEVTVAMIIDVLAEEFPEFLLVVAEENFIRGYQQAIADVDADANKKPKKKKKT
jgi:hypothetical protein